MEMNVEKTKVMRTSRHPFPVKIMIDQKQLENVESFKNVGYSESKYRLRISLAHPRDCHFAHVQ